VQCVRCIRCSLRQITLASCSYSENSADLANHRFICRLYVRDIELRACRLRQTLVDDLSWVQSSTRAAVDLPWTQLIISIIQRCVSSTVTLTSARLMDTSRHVMYSVLGLLSTTNISRFKSPTATWAGLMGLPSPRFDLFVDIGLVQLINLRTCHLPFQPTQHFIIPGSVNGRSNFSWEGKGRFGSFH